MILNTEPASWATYKRSLPDGYQVISTREALDPKNKIILTSAREFIDRNVKSNAPIGHQEFKDINGRQILFVVEPHYHEPGGKTKPWGWHHGATVFVPPKSDVLSFLDWNPGFGAEHIMAGKDWPTRLKRFAGPAALAVLTVVNPLVGGAATIGVLSWKHLHKQINTPFKGVPVSPAVHAASPLPV